MNKELEKLTRMVYAHLSEVAQIGHNPITENHISELNNLVLEAYKKGYIDGGIAEITK